MRHVWLTIALLLTAVPASRAEELVLGWDVFTLWNSNVFRTPDDQSVVFRTEDPDDPPVLIEGPGAEDDFSMRTGPNAHLRDRRGDLTYDLNTQMRYEAFLDLTDANDFEYFATGSSEWQITRTTRFGASDSFASSSNVAAILDITDPLPGSQIDPTTSIIPQRQRFTTNDAQATLSHRLAPAWEIQADFTNQLGNYEQEGAADSSAFSGALQLTHFLSPRTSVGLGATFERQTFDPGRATNFYQGFAAVSYRFSPTLVVTARGGPAWSVPEELSGGQGDAVVFGPATFPGTRVAVNPLTCPTDDDGNFVVRLLPQNRSDLCGATTNTRIAPVPTSVPFDSSQQQVEGSLTYFGAASIRKSWRNWNASLTYDRRASNSAGVGASTTLDALSLRVTWTPTRDWTIDWTASATRQTLSNDIFQPQVVMQPVCFNLLFGIPGQPEQVDCDDPRAAVDDALGIPLRIEQGDKISNPLEITSFRVNWKASRRFGRNLRVELSASYWRQENGGSTLVFVPGAADSLADTSLFLDQERNRHAFRIGFGVTWEFDPIVL